MSETDVSRLIKSALGLFPGVKLERQQSGKVRVRGGFMNLAEAGSADLVGCVLCHAGAKQIGRYFALEIKKPGGRTSPERAMAQSKWRAEIAACGGYSAQVSSVEEAIKALQSCRRLEPRRI